MQRVRPNITLVSAKPILSTLKNIGNIVYRSLLMQSNFRLSGSNLMFPNRFSPFNLFFNLRALRATVVTVFFN